MASGNRKRSLGDKPWCKFENLIPLLAVTAMSLALLLGLPLYATISRDWDQKLGATVEGTVTSTHPVLSESGTKTDLVVTLDSGQVAFVTVSETDPVLEGDRVVLRKLEVRRGRGGRQVLFAFEGLADH